MASTSAKINVIVDGLKQVQALERSLSKITSLTGKINGVGRSNAVEKNTAKLQEAKEASMVRTRSIGDQIQKAADRGLNVAKARRAIDKASLANDQGKLKKAKALTDAALTELKAEQATTKELAEQVKFSKLLSTIRGSRGGGSARPNKFNDRGTGAALKSGLISGAFPLLFGQGPLGGLAGFGGGFLGTKFGGQMGGFAGGLVATAVLQQITQTLGAISSLGKALNPLTADISSLSKASGLLGTTEANRLALIEQVRGKQAALNAGLREFEAVVGKDGVQALQEFGRETQALTNAWSKFMSSVFSSVASALNKSGIAQAITNLLNRGNNKNFASSQYASTELQNRSLQLTSVNDEIARLEGNVPTLKGGAGSQDIIMDVAELERRNKLIDELKNKRKVLNQIIKDQSEREQAINDALETRKLIDEAVLGDMEKENIFLNNVIEFGREEATLKQKVTEAQNQYLKILQQVDPQVKELSNLEKTRIKDAVTFNDELNKTVQIYEEIRSIVATGLTSAIQGLIDGTKTLSESLSGVLRQLGQLFLQRSMNRLVDKIIPFEEGGYLRSGSFKAFQYGGVVSSPTLGMIGEGGEPEYVIPSSKMSGAMARYSAGARGGAVIPGGSGASGTVAGSSGNTIVEYTGPVLNFNGDEYVPKDSVPQIINAAAKQGATLGQSRTLNTLKNSRSSRAKIGI